MYLYKMQVLQELNKGLDLGQRNNHLAEAGLLLALDNSSEHWQVQVPQFLLESGQGGQQTCNSKGASLGFLT
jgi:hypothetical protein